MAVLSAKDKIGIQSQLFFIQDPENLSKTLMMEEAHPHYICIKIRKFVRLRGEVEPCMRRQKN